LERERESLLAARSLAEQRAARESEREQKAARAAAWQRAVDDAEALREAVDIFCQAAEVVGVMYGDVLQKAETMRGNLPAKLDPHSPWLHRSQIESRLRAEIVRHGRHMTWANPAAATYGIHDIEPLSAAEIVAMVRSWALQETGAQPDAGSE
jgi:hypothetical protein